MAESYHWPRDKLEQKIMMPPSGHITPISCTSKTVLLHQVPGPGMQASLYTNLGAEFPTWSLKYPTNFHSNSIFLPSISIILVLSDLPTLTGKGCQKRSINLFDRKEKKCRKKYTHINVSMQIIFPHCNLSYGQVECSYCSPFLERGSKKSKKMQHSFTA